ncbi:polysaccharide deacetylase family protein [Rhizobium sp. WW_1]|jgi:peptidoglycan/xylan/chitin deacetylase (PgdA/CDA1 family)|uniref:polysaccharide deacetylase family protein n=1 Tax=Rhizobium sp. WW_1 TaxID=1907375 RepID=UPI0006467FCC|nr:polysaccharide deacetylase family protein [Rhizobium sp. WW_1]RKD50795.1 peptidoglycan/xylan/chitin deacetylase (PgdA/CDA1 family) [Rhizobium sp. WW_1]
MMGAVVEDFWPQGKTCAAIVSVIFDDGLDAVAQAPDLKGRSKSFSVWQYGATRGVERLCNVFADAGARTSWFVPGIVAQNHEQLLRDVVAPLHEIESHGWNFERYDTMSATEAIDLLRRSRDALNAIASNEVSGFRLPAGNWPRRFDRLLVEAGYRWSASLNGDDVPYSHSSSLVEIPVHIELEDRPYFQFNFTPAFPKGQSRIPSYEAVLGNWIAEFDAYRKYGLCYVIQLRPEWTGTPGRIALVEALLAHITSFDDVWLATAADVARWHAGKDTVVPGDHPINVYEAYVDEERAGER